MLMSPAKIFTVSLLLDLVQERGSLGVSLTLRPFIDWMGAVTDESHIQVFP